jgi:hypothetical protein
MQDDRNRAQVLQLPAMNAITLVTSVTGTNHAHARFRAQTRGGRIASGRGAHRHGHHDVIKGLVESSARFESSKFNWMMPVGKQCTSHRAQSGGAIVSLVFLSSHNPADVTSLQTQ